ncbi:hypothetical protein [Maribacter sp.]|uniref:hypothetical protein n=1 Tax=Maribacter sp. TaxID=1897614 RepID=UPI0032986E49
MSILKNIFRFKTDQKPELEMNLTETTQPSNSNTFPSKDLFIEEQYLEEKEQQKESANLITQYLDKDFYQLGVNEGFTMHSNEAAQSRIKIIKSDFRNILNQLMNKNSENILKLKNTAIEVADISKELKEKIENQIEFLTEENLKFNQEKIYSSEGEGLVMSAIHNYRQGFTSGLKSHLDMENLLIKNN